MNLSRRSLLTGLLSSAAVIAAGPVAKVIPSAPATARLTLDEFLTTMSQQISQTIIYGNDTIAAVRFTGFAPFYETISVEDFYDRPQMVGTFPRNSNAGMTFREVV